MRRGEIWWVTLPQPMGRRPAVLLTREAAYRFLASFTVALITRAARKVSTHVAVGPDDGLPEESAVNLDDLYTIPAVQFTERICELSPRRMREVDEALRFALELD